jgi:hypothetical protein
VDLTFESFKKIEEEKMISTELSRQFDNLLEDMIPECFTSDQNISEKVIYGEQLKGN